ncbi:hypothetical protein I4U23_022422 [Adineta vaga]|nr:hypothetical protein I4U23_022422 [Adineta vaga]
MIVTTVLIFLPIQCLLERTTISNDCLNITYQAMNVNHVQRSSITIHNLIQNLSILFIIIQSSEDIEQIIYTILRFCLPSKSHPTPSSLSTDNAYPMVAVQLPMMNEKEFCISMITCACNLDWSKDRLIIQVLDDSTDEIVMKMIDQCVQEWFDRGYRISVIRRQNRQGFKAGNLKNGLEKIQECEFIALFDVDFLPKKNFLLKTIPILLKDPKAAYAQARWTFINGKESLLTQMQEIVLNHHHKCEQEVKYRMSSFFQFNGSACVWRTKAIYQCGGWHTDTLVEDLDISVRAHMNGWHSAYIVDVECLNELPPTFTAYLSQQYRWFSGPAQVFRKLFQTVCTTSHMNIYRKLHCLWMLFRPCLYIIRFIIFLLNIAINACLQKKSNVNMFITFFPILLTSNILYYTSEKIHLTIVYSLFCNAMLFHHAISAIAGFLNLNSAKKWIVTPKFGTQTRLNIEEIQVDAYHNDNTNVQCCKDCIHSIPEPQSDPLTHPQECYQKKTVDQWLQREILKFLLEKKLTSVLQLFGNDEIDGKRLQELYSVINPKSTESLDKLRVETFEKLQMNYANVLKCPCSQIAVKYERFIHMQPIYHQICSSVFINDDWISSTFPTDIFNLWPMDVRRILSAHAQFLRSFCKNAQKGIDYALSNVLSSSLVSAEILSRALVQLQVNIQYESVRSAGQWHLSVLISFLRLVLTGSRLMNGLGTNSYLMIKSNDSLTANIGINIYQLNSSTSPCYCVTMDNCAMPGAIYTIPRLPTFGYYNLESLTSYSIPIQGIQPGCYPLESVLGSTLECYYNLTCIELLISTNQSFQPLSTILTTRFLQSTTIETLLNELMVEQWLVNSSYEKYFTECAPLTCEYSYNQRNHILIILTTIIALIGGLNTGLRIFIPSIVRLIDQLIVRNQVSHQRPVVICYEERSKMNKIKKKFLWFWLKIKMLNLFDSKSNDIIKQKYERHTTRLYIFVIIITFIALLCYTVITEETIVYTVQNPSLETYEKLYQTYSDTLQCICTKISIPYSKIISFQASYHQICTSSFVDPTFFSQLAFIRNDIYYSADFILLSVEYFQWLTTFCRLSQLVFYNQLLAFQTNLFINNKLLTRDTFEIQATQLADFFINDVQLYFARGIKQMREMIGITQLMSATSTLTYKLPIRQTISGSQIQVLPLQFFSNCSCLSNPTSCSDDAAFYLYNSLTQSFDIDFKIEGIHIACSSMETLFQSNLACWYSSDCYQTVIKYWQNRTYFLSGLPTLLNNSISSRFESSTSLSTIIEHLMLDNWSKNISFNSYYTECIPQYCTYSITERRNILIVITILIGLFGGLNVVLKLSIPLIVQLGNWFITHRKG